MKATLPAILAALIAATPVHAQTTGTAGDATPQPKVPAPTRPGLYFRPDAGIVYQSSDFRLTAWGFAERLSDPDGPDTFRRVRQGAEIDLPRINEHLRIAGVYEIDLTDTNAFGINPGPHGPLNSHDFENLFVAVQDADDKHSDKVLRWLPVQTLKRSSSPNTGSSSPAHGTAQSRHFLPVARRSMFASAVAFTMPNMSEFSTTIGWSQ